MHHYAPIINARIGRGPGQRTVYTHTQPDRLESESDETVSNHSDPRRTARDALGQESL